MFTRLSKSSAFLIALLIDSRLPLACTRGRASRTKVFSCRHARAWQHWYVSRIVGIDLGTTNSLVATVDAGIPLVIANAEGQRLTPSVVHVPGPGAEPVVGLKANRVRVIKPAETVYSVKRFIGRRGAEISRE